MNLNAADQLVRPGDVIGTGDLECAAARSFSKATVCIGEMEQDGALLDFSRSELWASGVQLRLYLRRSDARCWNQLVQSMRSQ